MGAKFWFFYSAFFVFVFPLFFSFSGGFLSSPIWATISLCIGIIAWCIFIYKIYARTIVQPLKTQRNIHRLLEDGKRVQGTVQDKVILLKKQQEDTEMMEIAVSFQNLEGTPVKKVFQFLDTKPRLKRYETGRTVDLRLSRTFQVPAIILADTQTRFSWKTGFFACLFVVAYMLGTFAWHYATFSNGHGWRFLSLWHPWLMTPFMGLLLFSLPLLLGRFFGGGKDREEKLLLFGKKATAVVQHAEQTGTYINEQPQIRYILKFTDDKGKEHVVTFKKIVSLMELHTVNADTQDILYLPEDPEQLTFC